MAEETQPSKKAVVMRVWILLFLIGFGLRIFRATVGDAPVAAAELAAGLHGSAVGSVSGGNATGWMFPSRNSLHRAP